jgi:hypothetical protein
LPIFSGIFIVERQREGIGSMALKAACFCDRGPNAVALLANSGGDDDGAGAVLN